MGEREERQLGLFSFLTSHAEIALSPTESQTTPSKSNAQTSLADFDDAVITVLVLVREAEDEEGVEVEKVDFDRRRAIASRDEAPLRPLLLLLLSSNESIGNVIPECVLLLLKRAPRGSIEGRKRERETKKGERERKK